MRFLALLLAMGLSLTVAPPIPAQKNHTLSLSQAIERALTYNEDVLIARSNLRASGAQVREAWAEALPEVSFSGLYARNIKQPVFFFPNPITGEQTAFRVGSKNSYSAAINVQQPIFKAGKIGRGLKSARLYREFSQQAYQATEGDVRLAAIESYYQVLLSAKLIEVNQQSVQQSQRHLENTRLLFLQGQVAEFDTLRAYVDYVNLLPALIRSENEYAINLTVFKNWIDVDLDDTVTFVDSLVYRPEEVPSLGEALAIAMQRRPELLQAGLQVGILQQNIGIVRSNILPSLYLNGSWQSQAQSDEFDFGQQGFVSSLSASLQLQIPIFDGFRTYAQVDQARADHRNALYEKQKLEDQVRVEVKSYYFSMQEAMKSIEAQSSGLRQARRALTLADLRYREGQSTALDVGDARLALNRAQSNYYEAIYIYLVAVNRLKRAIGLL